MDDYIAGLMDHGSGISVSWRKGEPICAHVLEFTDPSESHWGLVWECQHRHRVYNAACWDEACKAAGGFK